MSLTLVCVDMQAKFKASITKPHVRANALREITLALEQQASIIFLEFAGFGETLPELTAPVAQYKRTHFAIKDGQDGSVFVRKAVEQKAFYSEWFRVIGVNTDQCVFSTTNGLRQWYPRARIEVVADACESDWNHRNGLAQLKKLEDIVILNGD